MDGNKITLGKLLRLGLVGRLLITEKSQLKQLSEFEKLGLTLAEFYEEYSKGIFEAEFQNIHPSYYSNHLDDVRSFITIKKAACGSQNYVLIPQGKMVSEDSVDILSQIDMYRAMVYRKPYIIQPRMKLIAEDRHTKIYASIYFDNKFITNSFSGQTTNFPENVVYFSKLKAYQVTRLDGDVFPGMYEEEEEGLAHDSAHLSDAVDDIGLENINNMMEA